MKRRLLVILLLVPGVLVVAAASGWLWLWHTEAGARWAWQQAVDRLAESPRAAQLDAQIEGTLGRGLHLRAVRYADADVTVSAERGSLSGGVGFSPATITVSRLGLSDLEVVLAERPDDEASQPFPPPDLNLRLPLPLVVRKLEINGGAIHRGDFSLEVDSLAARARWFEDARLEVTHLETPEVSGALKLRAGLRPPFDLESEYRIDRLAMPQSFKDAITWLPDTLTATGTLRGDIEALSTSGTAHWPDWIPSADFEARLDQPFDSRAWSGRVSVPQASVPDRRMAADFHGVTLVVEGESDRLERWSAEGDADVRADDWPAGRVSFSVTGEGREIHASASAPEIFGGSLTLAAQAKLSQGTPWQGQLTAEHVSVAPLLESLAPHIGDERARTIGTLRTALEAEVVDTRLNGSGTLEPLQFAVEIERLASNILDRDMNGHGTLEYVETGLNARNLTMESGASRIVASGSFTSAPGLELEMAIVDLDDFLPNSAGRLTGTASYVPDTERGADGTRLRADLQGEHIEAFNWTVEDLRVSNLAPGEVPDGGVVAADPPFALSIQGQEIEGPAGPLESLSARLAGSFEHQALDASAKLRGSTLEATLSGGRGDTGWAGTLEHLAIIPPESGTFGPPWTLQDPAAVRFTGGAEVDRACLGAEVGSNICFSVESTADGTYRGTVTLKSLVPELFGPLTGSRLSFSQRLDGTLDWSRRPDGNLSATADLSVSAGVIVDEAEDLELLQTREGAIRFTMEEGSLTSGVIDLPFEGGAIDVDLVMPGLLSGGENTLEGRIRVEANDLRSLSSFLPQLAQTAGRLSADVRVSGTGANPGFEGSVRLENGRAYVIVPGLRLSDVNVTGQLSDNGRMRLDGGFLASEGAGELHGKVDLSDPLRPTFDARLSGESLTLVDVPELRVDADTDVTANWDGEALELSGRIHVPAARFAPSYLPSETASESPDVVIVAGDDPRPNGGTPTRDWNIRGSLEVSMGDDVVIDLDLARATMTGSVTFDWQGSPIPVAHGEYSMQGEIQAYGQQLEITRALIRYPDVPANNPHLEIRGERRIYGNSMISRAGVFVHGTLKRPITEPYTVPETNADRARALLITGSDFDYEQGVGAVNVGTYIAPKLYLSYGVGLFEEGNVISARYELKSNFGVKATSGQDETGIDFTYTIEK